MSVVTVVEREPHGLVALWLVGTRSESLGIAYIVVVAHRLSLSLSVCHVHTHDGSMAKHKHGKERVGIERGTGGIIYK